MPAWISELSTLNCGVTPDHQPTFSGAGGQSSWFLSRAVERYSRVAVMDDQRTIAVPGDWNDHVNVDMITWENPNFDGKRFYAYVIDKIRINNNVTNMTFEIAAYQTFMFDLTIAQCFVEREHIIGDEIGANIVPEGLETGPYTVTKQEAFELGEPYVVLAYAADSDGEPVGGQESNNVYSGARYFGRALGAHGLIDEFIQQYSTLGLLDGIVGIIQVPGKVYNNQGGAWIEAFNGNMSDVNGYIPKNKKLFVFPYNLLNCTNNMGQDINLQFELFNTPTNCVFDLRAHFSLQAAVALTPRNYRSKGDSPWADSLIMSNFPLCAFSGNAYANWLAQNAGSIAMGFIGNAAKIIGGAMVGGAIGAGVALTGALSAGSSLASVYDHSINQTSIKGQVSANSANFTFDRMRFDVLQMQVTAEMAQCIDDYFTAFGYKTNRTKTPNIRTRPLWNYVKTANACVKVGASGAYRQSIENMLNNGVTFWHVDKGATIGDYTGGNEG